MVEAWFHGSITTVLVPRSSTMVQPWYFGIQQVSCNRIKVGIRKARLSDLCFLDENFGYELSRFKILKTHIHSPVTEFNPNVLQLKHVKAHRVGY